MTPIVCTRLCCARRSVVVVVVVESLRSVGGQQRVQAWLGRLVLVARLPGPLSVGRGLSLHVPRARPTARTARFHRLPTAMRSRRLPQVSMPSLCFRKRECMPKNHGGSRVVSVLVSVTEGPRFKSQSRRCRVAVLGKLFTPIVPLFTKQRNW